MATIRQQRYTTSTNGNGVTHDLNFSSSCAAGSTIIAVLFGNTDVGDITGATINGMTSTSATLDYNPGQLVINYPKVYRYTNITAAATGFQFTMSTAHFDLTGWILEITGLTSTPFIGGGTFDYDFNNPTELDAVVTGTVAGDIAFAYFKDVPLENPAGTNNIASLRTGFTRPATPVYPVTDLIMYNDNIAGTTTTGGATLSTNIYGTAGYAVAYRAGASSSPTTMGTRIFVNG